MEIKRIQDEHIKSGLRYFKWNYTEPYGTGYTIRCDSVRDELLIQISIFSDIKNVGIENEMSVECKSIEEIKELLYSIITTTDPIDNEGNNIIQLVIAKENVKDIEQILIDIEKAFRDEQIQKKMHKTGVETNGVNEIVWESDEDYDEYLEDEEYYDEDDDEYYFEESNTYEEN